MNKTLLQKAQEYQPKPRYKQARKGKWASEEGQDLAIAYLQGEVGFKAAAHVVNAVGSNFYNFFTTAIRAAYREGRIKVK